MKNIVGMIEREWESLRKEQEFLKRCQLQYFLFSITVVGLFLGLIHREHGDIQNLMQEFPAIFLAPLIVIFPCWWIFFDKAKTIARIVGYLQVLEFMLLSDDPKDLKKFKGWERSLAEFRRRYESNSLLRPENIRKISLQEQISTIRHLKSTHKYWSIHFISFASVSVVCLILALGVFRIFAAPYALSAYDIAFRWFPLILWIGLFFLFIKMYRHTFSLLQRLIYGRNSYDAHEYAWRRILELDPPNWIDKLSEDELVRLGHKPESALGFD